ETRRLRDRDAALTALRDSLRNAPVAPAVPTAENVATMNATIHFAFDKSELTDSAKAILDDKIAVFRVNPTMSIVMVGYTDLIGTDAYNMALGTRRANAAKAYLVGHGVESSRVTIESKGERHPVTDAPGIAGQAPNRRAIFRIVMASDEKAAG
ncbi:MAG: OmpA family protein, partial [Gemmatimonadaceae bacterium]